MPWNSRWALNSCKAEVTSKHDVPLNSTNSDTSTLWHKMIDTTTLEGSTQNLSLNSGQLVSKLCCGPALCPYMFLNWEILLFWIKLKEQNFQGTITLSVEGLC